MRSNDNNSKLPGNNHNDNEFESAVQALFSSQHQATTKEEIVKAAKRRTVTVEDMRDYWGCLELSASTKKNTRRMIHITGTKGKGSTACFCESILRAHGYSTGLFTSPHLIDIRERVRWNGRPVHREIFGKAYWKIRRDLENHSGKLSDTGLPTLPGYFRMLTLMAYYILEHLLEVDVLIIEVGMGGRYDATNFWDVTPESKVVSGVTKLDLDHTRILGNTVERIAWEKGGIFAIDKANKTHISPYEPSDDDDKPNTTSQNGSPCFVLDSNTPGVVRMFRSCAKIEGESMALQLVDAKGTQLRTALKGQPMGLAGQHQYGNATLATQLCQAIVADTTIAIDDPKTLHAVRDATWPGRCQILEQAQWTHLLDGAHTLDSMTATVEFFTQQVQKECAMVFNCSHERNPIELLQLLLPLPISKVYFAKSDFSRPSPIAVPKAIALLQEEGITIHEDLLVGGDKPTWQETLGSIWKHLKYDEATSADVQCNWSARQILDDLHANHQACQVLVTGSLYLVGSFLTALEWKEESSPGEEDI